MINNQNHSTAEYELAKLFVVDPQSPQLKLAQKNFDNSMNLIKEITAVRKEKFPELEEFAKLIGVPTFDLLLFEYQGEDYSLDFINLYCLGLGIEVQHSIAVNDLDKNKIIGAAE